jgi:hypothetical protein
MSNFLGRRIVGREYQTFNIFFLHDLSITFNGMSY